MKKIALVFLLAAGLVARADDPNLLQNGDFSSGIAHWEGDCHSPSSTDSDTPPDFTASPAAATASPGVYIKLRHEDWTKMTQDFDGKIGQYTLTVTYSLSADAKFSTTASDYANIPESTGFSLFRAFSSTPGKWIVIISDLGSARFTYYEASPADQAGSTATQTATFPVKLNSGDDAKKAVCLVFPPGEGTVTIKSVTLVPQTQGQ
jgi:hypothetical protein